MTDRQIIIYTRNGGLDQEEACMAYLAGMGLDATVQFHDEGPAPEEGARFGLSQVMAAVSAPADERHLVVVTQPAVLGFSISEFQVSYLGLHDVADVRFVTCTGNHETYGLRYMAALAALDIFAEVEPRAKAAIETLWKLDAPVSSADEEESLALRVQEEAVGEYVAKQA